MSATSQRRATAVLAWLAVTLPVWVYLVELPDFGRMQNNDYYVIVGELVEDGELSRDPVRWLTLKSNEHRATLPMLVYAANMALTDGHNLGLTLFSLAMMTVTLVILVRLLPADLESHRGAWTLFGFALALFCYTPVAAHNVAMGFSGTQWLTSNALSVAAIAVLTRRSHRESPWSLWPVLLFGVLGAFTYSTHLLLWPALLAGGLLLKAGSRKMVVLAAFAVAVLSLFALSYQPIGYHPEPETRDFGTLLRYTAVFAGGLFSADPGTAEAYGWLGVAGSVAALIAIPLATRRSSELRRELAPWWMLTLYGFGNALGTGIARSGFGIPQAMSSRYAAVAALLWIGILAPIGVLAWRFRPASRPARGALTAALIALLAALAVPMHSRGARLIESFVDRGDLQEVAALALVHGIEDEDVLRRAVAPWPIAAWRLRGFLRKTGHVPFDREAPLRLGERVEKARLSDRAAADILGTADALVKLPRGIVRMTGWAYSPEATVEEVLLLDGEGEIRGEVVTGLRRPDVAKVHGPAALRSGWQGYAVVRRGAELRPWVRLAGSPDLHPLPVLAAVAAELRATAPAD